MVVAASRPARERALADGSRLAFLDKASHRRPAGAIAREVRRVGGECA
jgi:hypothetical protein